MTTRPAIARVRSMGSARSGVTHWKNQRLTSVASLLLTVWFALFVLANAGGGYAELRASLATPFNAAMMILFVAVNFWHTQQGAQVIIEDYVHHEGAKMAALLALGLACMALTALCVVATLKIALGS